MRRKIAVTIILDRSGSMQSIRQSTIDGLRDYIKELPKSTPVEVHQFDSWGAGLDIKKSAGKASDFGEITFTPRGNTPLLDAVGTVVSGIRKGVRDQIVVIMTDGYENASREWNRTTLKNLISDREKEGWQFVFMGAGIDAYGVASDMGINRHSTYAYAATDMSNSGAFANLTRSTTTYTSGSSATITMPDVDTEDASYTPPTS